MNLLSKLRPYIFPSNPVDQSLGGRFKMGLINYSAVNSWWNIKTVQRWISKTNFRFFCTIEGQQKLISVSGGDPTHLWVANEVLVERVYNLSQVPFVPDLIYDFGANIGLFSLLAATHWPGAALICVEPHPATFTQLAINLRENRIAATMLQCAVDAEQGFKFLKNDGAVFQELSETQTDVRVLCVKLDSLITFAANERVLIKMDIEGAEEAVLSALSKQLPENCFIFIELHQGDASLAWIQEWSGQNGFRFVEVRRRNQAIDGYLVR